MPHHVLAGAGPADVDAELEEFAMNPWRAPKRVLTAHFADQFAGCLGDRWASSLSAPDFPCSEGAKAFPAPGNDRLWLDDHEGGPPVTPDPAQCGKPEKHSTSGVARAFSPMPHAFLPAEPGCSHPPAIRTASAKSPFGRPKGLGITNCGLARQGGPRHRRSDSGCGNWSTGLWIPPAATPDRLVRERRSNHRPPRR